MLELGTRVVMVDDLVTAERFYVEVLGEVLGGSLETRYMLSTDELLESQRRGGARPGRDGDAALWRNRPPHSNVTVGRTKISIYLAPYHIQEPPPEQLRGAPRLAISATNAQLQQAVKVLQRQRV